MDTDMKISRAVKRKSEGGEKNEDEARGSTSGDCYNVSPSPTKCAIGLKNEEYAVASEIATTVHTSHEDRPQEEAQETVYPFVLGKNDVEEESENCGAFRSNAAFKKDRFNEIRHEQFKAIGIDVKVVVPRKDFYSMTEVEKAASVAAEFEEIDSLVPKREDLNVIKYMDFSIPRFPHYVSFGKIKRVVKTILQNPLLAHDKILYARRALLARIRERNEGKEFTPEAYFKDLDRTLDISLGPIAEKILERHNPIDITALDPVDVVEAVSCRNDGEVHLTDSNVQGLHTLSSVMRCLPPRMRDAGKDVNVASALAAILTFCSENKLTLVQNRVNTKDRNVSVIEGERWMSDLIIINAVDDDK